MSVVRHHAAMAIRKSRADEARANAKAIRESMGREVRLARTAAGASLREAGARVGMSHAQMGRIERAVTEHVSVEQLSLACAAAGLKLIVRAVPGAGPAIDAAQLALLDRFRKVLPRGARFWTEVPLPIPGDLRACDGIVALDRRVAIEAETRLGDIQALDRRCQLKLRDGAIDILILLPGGRPPTAGSS